MYKLFLNICFHLMQFITNPVIDNLRYVYIFLKIHIFALIKVQYIKSLYKMNSAYKYT